MVAKRLYKELRQRIGNAQLDEPMSVHTSFRIGGSADVFTNLRSIDDVLFAITACRDAGFPYLVIGRGTNLLVSDEGYRGAILRISDGLDEVRAEGYRIFAQAGAGLSSISRLSVGQGLRGLEFAGGIPGTLGGGIMMNAGAYGGEMKDCVTRVRVLDAGGELRWHEVQANDFGYRRSVFAERGDIVLEAELTLWPDSDGAGKLAFDANNAARISKQPINMPSAGSIFKRPKSGYAAAMIEEAGLKGASVGGAMVSELHAGFIVNAGGATCADVLELVALIKRRVFELKGVELELEVRLVGGE